MRGNGMRVWGAQRACGAHMGSTKGMWSTYFINYEGSCLGTRTEFDRVENEGLTDGRCRMGNPVVHSWPQKNPYSKDSHIYVRSLTSQNGKSTRPRRGGAKETPRRGEEQVHIGWSCDATRGDEAHYVR